MVFHNPKDGTDRAIKVGLDYRRLVAVLVPLWPVSLATCCLHCTTDGFPTNFQDALLLMERTDVVYGGLLALIALLGGVWLAVWSPAHRARHYLREGWVLADPWSDASLLAARKWQLSWHHLIDC